MVPEMQLWDEDIIDDVAEAGAASDIVLDH
jgi:hypothetical protein